MVGRVDHGKARKFTEENDKGGRASAAIRLLDFEFYLSGLEGLHHVFAGRGGD